MAGFSFLASAAAAQVIHNQPALPKVGAEPPPASEMAAPAPTHARHATPTGWRSKTAEYKDGLHRYHDRQGCRYLAWRRLPK